LWAGALDWFHDQTCTDAALTDSSARMVASKPSSVVALHYLNPLVESSVLLAVEAAEKHFELHRLEVPLGVLL